MVSKEQPPGPGSGAPQLEIADEDIFAAMREIPGYLDITPADFKDVYLLAFRHARERIARAVKAGDLMTRDVAYVSPGTPLPEVIELMGRRRVSGVPVVADDGRVVGVVSDKDVLASLGVPEAETFMGLVAQCLKMGCQAAAIQGLTAADVMSSPVITVTADTPAGEVAGLLLRRRINRVPVLDADGRLVGIVARADLINLPGTKA
jgi:CBS domain-containing protein